MGEKERELYRQGFRFFVPTIVRDVPDGGLWIEDYFQSKGREASFDVSWCSRRVSCVDVTPVSLHVDKQFFLAQLYHGVADSGITMRVILHGMSNNIGYLIVATILLLT